MGQCSTGQVVRVLGQKWIGMYDVLRKPEAVRRTSSRGDGVAAWLLVLLGTENGRSSRASTTGWNRGVK
jgi:hypothetical protein